MYYIHNIYKNMSQGDINSLYGLEKLNQQRDIALNQIKKLENKFKKDIEKKTNNLITYQEIMEQLEDAMQQAATTSMQQLQAISGNAVREAVDAAREAQNTSQANAAIVKMSNQFANLRKAFESFLKAYEIAKAERDKDTPMGQVYRSNIVTLDRAAEAVRQSLLDPSWKRLAEGGFGQSTKDNFNSVRSFASQIATGKLFKVDDDEKSINPAAAIGFLAEGVFGNALKDITSTMTFGGKYKLGITATGANSGKITLSDGRQAGFVKKTSDISLELKGLDGRLTIQLPGISLKRTGMYGHKQNGDLYSDIQVKSSTTLGNMLNTTRISTNMENHIYNIIANNGRAAKYIIDNDGTIGETYQHPTLDLNNMYRWIYGATLLASFAGNLTTSDFANFWIVNDKIYTAPSIIMSAFDGTIPVGHSGRNVFNKYLEDASKSGIAKEAANIPAKHTEIFNRLLNTEMSMAEQGQQRSKEILSAIVGIKYSLHLRVSINKLIGY